jgi:hypothetical protein
MNNELNVVSPEGEGPELPRARAVTNARTLPVIETNMKLQVLAAGSAIA